MNFAYLIKPITLLIFLSVKKYILPSILFRREHYMKSQGISKKKRMTSSESGASHTGKIALSSLFGAAVSIGLMLLGLLVSSAICLLLKDPHGILRTVCLVNMYIFAFCAGFIASRRNGRSDALLCGVISGASFIFALWILSLVMGVLVIPTHRSPLSLLFKLISVIVSIVGAYVGISAKHTKVKHRF